MGCDIHVYVEKRVDGKWISADKWTRASDWEYNDPIPEDRERIRAMLAEVRSRAAELEGKNAAIKDNTPFYSNDNAPFYIEDSDDSDRIDVKDDDRFYNYRNYGLFAILADVRNPRVVGDSEDIDYIYISDDEFSDAILVDYRNDWGGGGGRIIGTGFNPISEPRGLPEDVSPEAQAVSDWYAAEGHSHSWLTLAELLAYDWNQVTRRVGIVGPLEFADFEKNGKPRSWCEGAFGSRNKVVSHQRMREEVARYRPEIDRVIAGEWDDPEWEAFTRMLRKQPEQYFTQVMWEERYAYCAQEFLDETLPKLQALGAPEDVRIVFFFDN
jgi:hypothetical protein